MMFDVVRFSKQCGSGYINTLRCPLSHVIAYHNEQTDMDVSLSQPNTGRATGWDIQGLIGDKEQLSKAKEAWVIQSRERPILDQTCNRSTLDLEVEWIEDTLTDLLNKYDKIMQVTPYSKRWRNKDVAQARKIWAKDKKIWEKIAVGIKCIRS